MELESDGFVSGEEVVGEEGGGDDAEEVTIAAGAGSLIKALKVVIPEVVSEVAPMGKEIAAAEENDDRGSRAEGLEREDKEEGVSSVKVVVPMGQGRLWPSGFESGDDGGEEDVYTDEEEIVVEEVEFVEGAELGVDGRERGRSGLDTLEALGSDDASSSVSRGDRIDDDELVEGLSTMTGVGEWGPKRPDVVEASDEKIVAREVYKLPGGESGEGGEVESQILLWPAGFLIEIIGFQIKLMVQAVYFGVWVLGCLYALMVMPIHKTLQAKDLLARAIGDAYALITQIKPTVKEGLSQTGPLLRQTTWRMGYGCLAASYVIFMLSTLLIPALFLDFFLVRSIVEEPYHTREVLYFDYSQPEPCAVVHLLPPPSLTKAKELAVTQPHKVVAFRAIPPSHKFHVTVYLTLPESDYNRHLGVFQVTVELLSVRGQVLHQATRPCMLQFHSSPVRYVKNILLGVPLLMGLLSESQTIALRVIENQEERMVPTASVRVLLKAKAGCPVGACLPELYGAELELVSNLPWMKEMLRKWKWTLYVWSGLSLFLFEILLVLCCCRQVLLPTALIRGFTAGFVEDTNSGPSQGSDHEVPKRGGKRGGIQGGVRKRVNFQDELPTGRPMRVPKKVLIRKKEPEVLSGTEETLTTTSGPKESDSGIGEVGAEGAWGSQSQGSGESSREPRSTEATSSWSVPPLEETLDYVNETVRGVEDIARNLGESTIRGCRAGMKRPRDAKDVKTD